MNSAHSSPTPPSRSSVISQRYLLRRCARRNAPVAVLLSALLLSVQSGAFAKDSSAPILTALATKAPISKIVSETTAPDRNSAQREANRSTRLTALSASTQTKVRVAQAEKASAAKTTKAATSKAAEPAVWKEGRRVSADEASGKTIVRVGAPTDATLSPLPPSFLQPRVLPGKPIPASANDAALAIAALPGLNDSSQIVQVQALKLPPVSKPLPAWMRNSVVSLEGQQISVPLPATGSTPNANKGRVAQNPDAPPIKQPQKPITSSDRLPNQVEVAASTYIVLVTKVDLATVAVADPEIADVAVVNARAILVNGKKAGTTTLVVVDRLGTIRQYQVRVVAAPGTRPNDIQDEIGIEGVTVRRVQGSIILEGEVATAEEMKRALDIAGIFSEKVINQLRVRDIADPGQLTALQIQEALARPDITVRVVGKTTILDGVVANGVERQRAEQIARAYGDGDVLNLLTLPTISVENLRELLDADESAPTMDPEMLGMGTIGMAQKPPRTVVRQVGDQVILEGQMFTQADIDASLAAASRTGLQVVNRLSLAPAPPTESVLLNGVAAAIGLKGVSVRGTSKRLVLQGVVEDSNEAIRAGQIALGFAPDVDNMIQVVNPTQVNVEVSIVEISNDNLKNLGVTFGGLATGQSLGSFGIGEGLGNATLGTTFSASLQAQIQKGNINLLSNPRTTVLSGHTASFQSGGQFPIPVSSQVNNGVTTIQVEFKDFGVLMDVTPIANTDGAVTMRVRTDITQIDPTTGSIQITPDVRIPVFTRRAAITEVTTQSGGTIALSGLISSQMRKIINEIPVLSKIPILGKLFTSKSFQRGESDLVIFVTPRVLPNVLREGQTAPATPIAIGPSTVAPTVLGNPGIQTFDSIGGANLQSGGTGGGQ